MSAAGKEFGVFLPIGNGGWMISRSAPHPEATYAYNRRVALDAEAIGLDFIMSMAKWKASAAAPTTGAARWSR